MNKSLFWTLTLSLVAAWIFCFILSLYLNTRESAKRLEVHRPKGLIGFGQVEPNPVV